jgi:hypothetical protein
MRPDNVIWPHHHCSTNVVCINWSFSSPTLSYTVTMMLRLSSH